MNSTEIPTSEKNSFEYHLPEIASPSIVHCSNEESVECEKTPSIQPSPVSTPPRSSLKRQVICNDSPMITPSKTRSVSQPVFVTPVKSAVIESKTAGVSPTKVVEEEALQPVVFENKSITLTVRMKRLLKEQEEERNRFRNLMQKQITTIQETFNIGLPQWDGVRKGYFMLSVEGICGYSKAVSKAICNYS